MIGYIESIWINCNKIYFFNLDGDDTDDDDDDDDNEEGNEDVDEADEEQETVHARQNRLKRGQLTSQRLVHSIDTALDIDNYDEFTIPALQNSIEGVFKVNNKKENDITYRFTNQPPANIGRQNTANIIPGPQGVKAKARNTESPRSAFELFFTLDMVQNIVIYTNYKINQTIDTMTPEVIAQKNLGTVTKECTMIEMSVFIGLFLYRGLWKQNTLSINKLFSEKYGPPIYAATMSRNRFVFLLKHICFDDERTRDERWNEDRFAAIRELFESFNNECMSCLVPGDYLSLDETLYPMRTQISFKQFNPSKPAKYGLLYKSINAARYPYTFIATPYCGKPVSGVGPYYVQGTENIVKYLVERLSKISSLKGRNISFDRLYMSISLELWLYERSITSIGSA